MSIGFYRHVAAGAIIGLIAGAVNGGLLIALGSGFAAQSAGIVTSSTAGWILNLVLAVAMGITYALLFEPAPGGEGESLMSGLAVGVLWWLIIPMTLAPVIAGQSPRWSTAGAATLFPSLLGYLYQGGIVGLGYHVLSELWVRWLGPVPEAQPAEFKQRIVVLGGGFSGVTTSRRLERLFGRDSSVQITLVSDINYLLFTPMLVEVTGSDVEPRHIAPALRAFFRRTRVVRGEVRSVDLAQRLVHMAPTADDPVPDIPYDHLVLAMGAVPNFHDLPGVEENSFTFKSLEAGMVLRNHVIDVLEHADDEPDDERRKRALTFVVAGGGFSGAELIGSLNDFVRGSLVYYPNIPPEDVSMILVHSKDRILPELKDSLAAYALKKLQERGVSFKLGVRVASADKGSVTLSNGETIRTDTLVWTAGVTPHPLMRTLAEQGAHVTQHGALETDENFAVRDQQHVWAIGDCASVPDLKTGKPAPATAQHALVEAPVLAHNIHHAIKGRSLKPFRYGSLGSLCLLGHHVAAAQVMGLMFSGMLAWVMWRFVYLYRLPTLGHRLRVALDWTVDVFFPREISETITVHRPGPRQASGQRPAQKPASPPSERREPEAEPEPEREKVEEPTP